MWGHRRIKPRDCSGEAGNSVAKKSKTGAMSVGSKVEEKSWGQRKARRGKSDSVKPLDLRKCTVARTCATVSGEGGLLFFSSIRRAFRYRRFSRWDVRNLR